jgi:hypothetical protein
MQRLETRGGNHATGKIMQMLETRGKSCIGWKLGRKVIERMELKKIHPEV